MADIKFSEFPKATTSKDSDEIAILQDGVNKMIASPILESKIINKTVSRVIEQGGASLNVINLKGVVPTYADLATITPTPNINDAYQVESDGLVYVYTDSGFQSEGDGFIVQPEPIGVVEEGNTQAVSGGVVFETVEKLANPIYNLVNSPNLANPKYIYIGKTINNTGNYLQDVAGFDLITFKVDPTKDYTVSGWNSTRSEIAFFSNEMPEILPSGNYSTGIIDAGTLVQMFGYGKVNGTVTFKPLATSKWGVILLKSNTENNSVYGNFQIEEGTAVTPYKPFGYNYVLKPEFKPVDLATKLEHTSTDKAETGVSVSNFVENVLKPFAEVLYSKNLADPTRIYPNFAINTNGIYSISGYTIIIQAVDFTKTYTVSGWNSFRDYIAFYSGDVPETATNLPPNLIQSGRINAVLGIEKNGNTATFQPLNNSTWMALLVKDTTESEVIYSKLQIEEGDFATQYIPFEGVTSNFNFNPENKTKITLKKDGDNILIRTAFNDAKDLVRSMALHGNANGAANLTAAKLIFKSENIEDPGERFHSMADSIPPAFQVDVAVNYPWFNVAGNHGLRSITDVTTSVNHGKTSADLGSIWADATGWEFYLIAIVSSRVLRLACKPQDIDGKQRVKVDPVSPAVHVSGAVNTGGFSFTGVSYEYKPSIRDIDVRLFADDKEITEDGDYNCDVVKVAEFYNIADPTKPNLTPPYLPQNNGLMLAYNLTHLFNNDNSSTHEGVANWDSNHYTKSHLVIVPQTFSLLTYSNLKNYANNVGIKDGYNFDTGVNFNVNLPAYITIVKEDLKNQNFHYNQYTQLIFSGSLPIIGGGYGLLPIDQGTSELQLLNDSILEFSSARKGHPRPFTGMTDNKLIRSIGYFSYWDASKNPKFSAAYSVKYGNNHYYMIQLKDDCVKETLFMNEPLKNRLYDVIHKTDGLILHTNSSTTNNGLVLSGSIGDWAILKIN